RSGHQNVFRTAHTARAKSKAAGIQYIERNDVAAPDFVQQIFFRHFAVFQEHRRGGAAMNSHFVFFVAWLASGITAFDDEGGKLFAVDFGEYDVEIREAAVGNPHLLPVQNIVRAFAVQFGAREGILRVGAGLGLAEAIRANQLRSSKLREILLFLRFGAEIDDWQSSDSRMRAVGDGKASIDGEL